MKTVIFPLEKQEGTNLILYPDDISLFKKTSNTVDNQYIVADYYGELELQPYVRMDELILDVTLSDGDGDTPIGIVNNGIMSVSIAYELKTVDGVLVPLSGSFRVSLRDSDGGLYDMINISFVDGSGSVDYTSDMKPAIVCIDGDDLSVPGTDAVISVEDDQYIKIYRELS